MVSVSIHHILWMYACVCSFSVNVRCVNHHCLDSSCSVLHSYSVPSHSIFQFDGTRLLRIFQNEFRIRNDYQCTLCSGLCMNFISIRLQNSILSACSEFSIWTFEFFVNSAIVPIECVCVCDNFVLNFRFRFTFIYVFINFYLHSGFIRYSLQFESGFMSSGKSETNFFWLKKRLHYI